MQSYWLWELFCVRPRLESVEFWSSMSKTLLLSLIQTSSRTPLVSQQGLMVFSISGQSSFSILIFKSRSKSSLIQGYSDGVFWERNSLLDQKKKKEQRTCMFLYFQIFYIYNFYINWFFRCRYFHVIICRSVTCNVKR